MLENVILHQGIAGHPRFDAIREIGARRAPEKTVTDNEVRGILLIHMTAGTASDAGDVLDPAFVGIVEDSNAPGSRRAIVEQQVLNAYILGQGIRPPRRRTLRRSPVRHVEARGDGDLPSGRSDGFHLRKLNLGVVAAASPTRSLTFRTARKGAANIDGTGVGRVVKLIENENLTDCKVGDTGQGDDGCSLGIPGRPCGEIVWTAAPLPAAAHTDDRSRVST